MDGMLHALMLDRRGSARPLEPTPPAARTVSPGTTLILPIPERRNGWRPKAVFPRS